MPTIYEIAKLTGVSPKTVARVLNGQSGRSKNRERILEAASQLGYVKNEQAAKLRSGKSYAFGIIVPQIRNQTYTRFMQSFHEAGARFGYHTYFASTFGSADEEVRAIRYFLGSSVEAIIINGSETPVSAEFRGLAHLAHSRGVPIIMSGRRHRDLPIRHIRLNNSDAVATEVQHLTKLGHHRIAHLTGPREHPVVKERQEGFEKAMREAGLEYSSDSISFGDLNAASGEKRMMELIRATRCTAVVSANDFLALGAMKAAQKAGVVIPDDLAIVGFDDIEMAVWVHPGLTTLRVPYDEIAEDTISELLPKNDDTSPSGKKNRKEYTPHLVVRGSTVKDPSKR